MATLGVTFAGAFLAMGGEKKSKMDGPPINATSKEEEMFIAYVRNTPIFSNHLCRGCLRMDTKAYVVILGLTRFSIQGIHEERRGRGEEVEAIIGG